MIDMLIEIKEIIAIIISLIIGIVILIQKLAKALKSKNKLNNIISLEAIAIELVSEAENFLNFSGAEKKEWVKTKVNQYAIDNGFKYNDETTDSIIEGFIDLSKKVNKREKDKKVLL